MQPSIFDALVTFDLWRLRAWGSLTSFLRPHAYVMYRLSRVIMTAVSSFNSWIKDRDIINIFYLTDCDPDENGFVVMGRRWDWFLLKIWCAKKMRYICIGVDLKNVHRPKRWKNEDLFNLKKYFIFVDEIRARKIILYGFRAVSVMKSHSLIVKWVSRNTVDIH